jgi:exopolysaccharide biosynthesis polyprenyl glycosylphosphotransferase
MLPETHDRTLTETALAGVVRHVREQRVDEILVLGSWGGAVSNSDILSALRMVPAPVKLIADQRLARVLAHASCDVAGARAMLVKPPPLGPVQRLGKRAFDVAAASLLLAALSPLLLIAAAAIKLDSPGPVLFRQWRGGFNGRRFRICKLRTMTVAEEGAAVRQARRGDARVTRVGRLLRASSIDELPQLFNVLMGDMSLVGPRPHAIVHDETYAALIAPYPARHNVKPGITGWAQVQGSRGETADAAQMRRRVEQDLSYIENWSFLLDLLIIGMTVREVVRPRNAY